MSNGYFEAYLNSRTYRETEHDRALMAQVTTIVREVVPGAQLRWAGSQRKSTAIINSDLDFIVESNVAVTEAQRRTLRTALESALQRVTVIKSHAIRIEKTDTSAKVDLSFANATFGNRPLPAVDEFHNDATRQLTARALKLWSRSGNRPYVPGWAIEAMVVHLDAPRGQRKPLELFLRVIDWLERTTPAALEGVLRPAAFPKWNPAWSTQLHGRLEALRNHARALLKRADKAAQWKSAAEVSDWLSQ